jgi:hypothetical protein
MTSVQQRPTWYLWNVSVLQWVQFASPVYSTDVRNPTELCRRRDNYVLLLHFMSFFFHVTNQLSIILRLKCINKSFLHPILLRQRLTTGMDKIDRVHWPWVFSTLQVNGWALITIQKAWGNLPGPFVRIFSIHNHFHLHWMCVWFVARRV